MTGVNGDYYLNVDTGDLYQKITGSWSLIGSLKGPAGSAVTSMWEADVNGALMPSNGTFYAPAGAWIRDSLGALMPSPGYDDSLWALDANGDVIPA